MIDPFGRHITYLRVSLTDRCDFRCVYCMAEQPEFAILFRRLRDRISTLRGLYGAGPLDIDFRAMGVRAEAVRLNRADLKWERVARKSGRTGQVHSLGGFTGEAEYEGDLAEFLPWLRAARWVGVGRQTVWGKGEVRVEEQLATGVRGECRGEQDAARGQ